MMQESGYPLLRDGQESYEIEEKYGYSLKRYLAAAFILRGKNCFSDFIRKYSSKLTEIEPGQGFYDLKKLQDFGMVHSIITRRIAGLESVPDAAM